MSYLARIEECEHGEKRPGCWVAYCRGGTTTRIEPDYAAASVKLAVRDKVRDRGGLGEGIRERLLAVRAVVDAALGGSE
jgi:hypothetical protein